MSLRKYGTGEILPEPDDMKKTSSQEDKEQVLAEVKAEANDVDEEK